MKIYYDKYEQPEQLQVHLSTPSKNPICTLNGIDRSSFNFNLNIKTISEITFDVNRFIEIDGNEIESNGYNLLGKLMRVYVDNIGWFIIETPDISNDGVKEIKSITALSAESEMQQHDLRLFKINCGTTDSYEMLVPGNVEIIGDVEFAKEQIKFHNPQNPELSLLDIALKESGLHGWEVGYIDNTPKTYREFINGKLVEKQVVLSNEIGTFDIETQDLYSFLTQDVAQFFGCVFVFDFEHLKINVYRPENLGKDTNINIGFRNLQQSNEITSDENNIFTKVYVQGSDGLGIENVNMGLSYIENIDYFLNEKYLKKETIEKYRLWKKDLEINRPIYIENTRLYNKQQKIISELCNRVPLDDCSTNWGSFSDEKLLQVQANYQAQKKGLESFYVDVNGKFDEIALQKSPDANEYYQIKDVILPSIQIEIDNRKLPQGTEGNKYIETYKTNWKLYGLDELEVKLQMYRNNKKLAEEAKCTQPYNAETSSHTEEYHTKMYNLYKDAVDNLDPAFVGGCQEAYDKRKSEVDSAKSIQDNYKKIMSECVNKTDKTTWKYPLPNKPGEFCVFTSSELSDLSKLYIDGDYSNENMFIVDSDDAVSAIDEQLKLLDAAEKDLSKTSQPQFIYSTSLDNFLSKYEYKNYTDNLNIGDFIHLGVRDDKIIKLRVVSMSYNPLSMDNNIQITFSNMIRGCGELDDFVDMLNGGGSISKNITGNGNGYTTNQGVDLTPALINKLVSSGTFLNNLQQIMGNIVLGNGGGSISLNELNAKMIKVVDLFAKNGFFEYLQAKLITADKIVAGSGNFKNLSALVAQIDNLLAGNISGELGHIIKLTAENVSIDQAVIRDLIAAQISVSMLQAGTISANKFNIKSDDGGLEIVGNTMQFKDVNGNIRIQIGRDATNNFTFTLYDETGKGVLIDSDGIKKSAISDGLIINNMIADGTLGKEKFNFSILETDASGNIVQNGQVVIDKNGINTEFVTIKNSVSNIQQQIESIETNAPYSMNIFSSNGTTFRHGLIDTYLSPNLYQGSNDITNQYPDKHFIWTRQSADSDGDRYWNEAHKTGTKSLHITNNDVFIGASFTCSFYLDNTIVTQAIF